jgi:hypothetical protein
MRGSAYLVEVRRSTERSRTMKFGDAALILYLYRGGTATCCPRRASKEHPEANEPIVTFRFHSRVDANCFFDLMTGDDAEVAAALKRVERLAPKWKKAVRGGKLVKP